MTDRELYLSIGICPNCRKNKIDDGYKSCSACREKNKAYVKKTNSEERRIKKLDCDNRRRAKLKEQGLCIQCGKNGVTDNHVRCKKCLAKRRKYNIEPKPDDYIYRKDRIANGLCYFCGNPTNGHTFCDECMAKREQGRKTKAENFAKKKAEREERKNAT